MPHSSGGGSSGGGFHSGSSSSGPSIRTSSRYFPGSVGYVYYGHGGRMHTVYTNGAVPKRSVKRMVLTYVLLGAFMIAGGVFTAFSAYRNPTKISTSYSTTTPIQDDLNVLSEEEKTKLSGTFSEFFTLSGICPSVLTINKNTWKGHYQSLSGYAFDAYINRFKDESHWLIVYTDDGNRANWEFEGMQGNDTDGILVSFVTDNFNKTVTESLSSSASVGASLEKGFRAVMPTMMEKGFRMETGQWFFLLIWEGIASIALIASIMQDVRAKGMQNAITIDGNALRANCPSCGNQYIVGTIHNCLRCGAALDKEGKF